MNKICVSVDPERLIRVTDSYGGYLAGECVLCRSAGWIVDTRLGIPASAVGTDGRPLKNELRHKEDCIFSSLLDNLGIMKEEKTKDSTTNDNFSKTLREKVGKTQHIIALPKLSPRITVLRLKCIRIEEHTGYKPELFFAATSAIMVELTSFLVKDTLASFGYVAHNEISLLYEKTYRGSDLSQTDVAKILTSLASKATNRFISMLDETNKNLNITFKIEISQFDSRHAASNYFLLKSVNTFSTALHKYAKSMYPDVSLKGRTLREIRRMLSEKDTYIRMLPIEYVYGVYIKLVKSTIIDTESKKEITRSYAEPVAITHLTRVVNKEDVLFDAAQPVENSANDATLEQ